MVWLRYARAPRRFMSKAFLCYFSAARLSSSQNFCRALSAVQQCSSEVLAQRVQHGGMSTRCLPAADF